MIVNVRVWSYVQDGLVDVPTPTTHEIVRVWDEQQGWMYEARDEAGNTAARSKHKDQLQDDFPAAAYGGRVFCGDASYIEG
jgi:hypothetical protein